MERSQSDSSRSTDTEPDMINYLPGMPTLSADSGLLERVFRVLGRRRGSLRPVYRDDGRSR